MSANTVTQISFSDVALTPKVDGYDPMVEMTVNGTVVNMTVSDAESLIEQLRETIQRAEFSAHWHTH